MRSVNSLLVMCTPEACGAYLWQAVAAVAGHPLTQPVTPNPTHLLTCKHMFKPYYAKHSDIITPT